MAVQLSLKVALPLAKILATASCRSSKTGLCIDGVWAATAATWYSHYLILFPHLNSALIVIYPSIILITHLIYQLYKQTQLYMYLYTPQNNTLLFNSWGWFSIKMPSYQYRKSCCGDKTILWLSYLHNGIYYTGKLASFYPIRAQTGNLFEIILTGACGMVLTQ